MFQALDDGKGCAGNHGLDSSLRWVLALYFRLRWLRERWLEKRMRLNEADAVWRISAVLLTKYRLSMDPDALVVEIVVELSV